MNFARRAAVRVLFKPDARRRDDLPVDALDSLRHVLPAMPAGSPG